MRTTICKTCKCRFMTWHALQRYCSSHCRSYKQPAVYRFICPDGRSYVGAVQDCRERARHGIGRSNPWLEAAFQHYPPETWVYEVLERLPPGCSARELRKAEHRYMKRLNSWDPAAGFNRHPAVWDRDSPARRRVSTEMSARLKEVNARRRAFWAAETKKYLEARNLL